MAIYHDMSRINHEYVTVQSHRKSKLLLRTSFSCTLNIFQEFDFPSFTCNLYAFRPIKAGEELVLPYIDCMLPHRKRQEMLFNRYLFKCHCKACTIGSASDTRRQLFDNALIRYEHRVNAYIEQPPRVPNMSEPVALDLISGLRRALDAAVAEGFGTGKVATCVMRLIWEMSMAIGDEKTALEIGKELLERAKERFYKDSDEMDCYADIEEIRMMRDDVCSRTQPVVTGSCYRFC